MFKSRPRIVGITAIFAAAAIVACSADHTTGPIASPLTGLSKTDIQDSTAGTPTTSGPGFFHGTVLAPSIPGSGDDSLANAPRIANVRVTIYASKVDGTQIQPGQEMGSVVTGADGKFTLPTLPAGQYVVTFVPPATSIYEGVYTYGPLNENSSKYSWWIVLPKKE